MFREERREREERVSLLALLDVGWLWLVVSCLVGRLSGRGAAGWTLFGGLWWLPPASPRSRAVRAWGSPLFGSYQVLFFPFLPVWFPPLAAVFRLWRMWGFCFSALLGCWSRQVVLSPFLGWSVSFPLLDLLYHKIAE